MKKFTTKEIGDKGEDYAVKFLKKNKYKILARNYRIRYGEIDIIAENKSYLVFVEVKTRHTDSLTQPYEAVDYRKQRRIIKAASAYLCENKTEKYCRFDICEVFVNSADLRLEKINYIEAAFEQESNYEAY